MQLKKNLFAASLLALAIALPTHAEDGWGDVSSSTDPGGWGAPAAEAVEEAAPAVVEETAAVTAPQAEPGKPACGTDDPRYTKLPIELKKLQNGEKIEPIQLSFATYIGMAPNIRKLMGDNLYISSPDCSEQHLFGGELTGKVMLKFNELWQVINNAIRTDDLGLLNFVSKNTRVEPESALNIMSMVQFVSLDDNQLRKLYTVIAPDRATAKELKKPLMLEIYLAFGGTVIKAERSKTIYAYSSRSYHLADLYLENNGGQFSPNLLNVENIVQLSSSLLSNAGLILVTEHYGHKAKNLASGTSD